MEKMVYERPVMRAQMFQANSYVSNCNRIPIIESVVQNFLKVLWNNKTFVFSTDRVHSRNPLNGVSEYYYREYNGSDARPNSNGQSQIAPLEGSTGNFFLSYNAAESAEAGKAVFYLYEDSYWSSANWESGLGTLQQKGEDIFGDINYGKDGIWISDVRLGQVDYTQGNEDVTVGYSFSG